MQSHIWNPLKCIFLICSLLLSSSVFAQSFIGQVQANMTGQRNEQSKINNNEEVKLKQQAKSEAIQKAPIRQGTCDKISDAGLQKLKDQSGYDLVNFVESNINALHKDILPLVVQNNKDQNAKILESAAKVFDHQGWYYANVKNMKDEVSRQLVDDETALHTNKDAIELDANLGLYFLRNMYFSFARIYQQQEANALKENSVEQTDKDRIKAQPLPISVRKAQMTECTHVEQRNYSCQLGEKLYNLTAQVSPDLTCGKYGNEFKQKAQAIYVVKVTAEGPKIVNIILPNSEMGRADMADLVRSNISSFENRKEFGRQTAADARESLKAKMHISIADLDLWKKQNNFAGNLLATAPQIKSGQSEGIK